MARAFTDTLHCIAGSTYGATSSRREHHSEQCRREYLLRNHINPLPAPVGIKSVVNRFASLLQRALLVKRRSAFSDIVANFIRARSRPFERSRFPLAATKCCNK